MIQSLPRPARAALLVAAIAVASALAGCSYDTFVDPTYGEWIPVNKPGPNSIYHYYRNDQDSAGRKTSASIQMSERVIDTGATIDGLHDIYFFFDGVNVSYYRYQPNGDLSIDVRQNLLKCVSPTWGGKLLLNTSWITLPFQSGVTRRDTLIDISNYDNGSGIVPLLIRAESVFQRSNNVFIDGALRTTFQVSTTITIDVGSIHNSILAIYNFAPTLGYFTSIDVRVNAAPSLPYIISGGFLKLLGSFTLK